MRLVRLARTSFAGIAKRKLRLPAVRVFLISAVLYLLTFQYCRFRYWRDPHSAFFDISRVYDWKYSLAREHEANHFISFYDGVDDPTPEHTKSSDEPLLCAAFVTVKRDFDNYFEESIGSMLEGLDPRERRALHLKVLFANTDPTKHPNWGQRWMNRVIDTIETYDVSETSFQHLQKLEADRDFREKGVFDYVYILNRCLATNAPYIGVFEDDIIFADGWMSKTLSALSELDPTLADPEQHSVESSNSMLSWLYIRLFYTETSLSWEDTDFAYHNMPLIFATAIGLGFLSLFTIRRISSLQPWLDYGTIAVLCLVTIPAFTGLYYMIGKYSVHPLQGLVPMDRYGCCTQGLIFPRQNVPRLVEYLEQEGSGQTDAMIEDFATKTGLRRYALAPQQLQHIGLRSSRDNLEINTQSTWAFWFEANDPRELRKEHDRLIANERMQRLLQRHQPRET